MLTIVFYNTNGSAAKTRAREICAVNKGDYARVYDAASWDGSEDKCDAVEIMDDVPKWHRKRIDAVYSDKIVDANAKEEIQEDTSQIETKQEENSSVEKKAVHRGGGRWFVMDGETIISGPHDKSEAQRLTSEEVAES